LLKRIFGRVASVQDEQVPSHYALLIIDLWPDLADESATDREDQT